MWGRSGFGDAHHFGDDQDGEGGGEVAHQVEVGFLLGGVEEFVDGVLD